MSTFSYKVAVRKDKKEHQNVNIEQCQLTEGTDNFEVSRRN